MPPIDDANRRDSLNLAYSGLSDPSHNAVRAELARLFIAHKADLGIGRFDDAEIVARVDDIMWHLWQRAALAAHTSNTTFAERFPWLVEAFERLAADQPAVKMDG